MNKYLVVGWTVFFSTNIFAADIKKSSRRQSLGACDSDTIRSTLSRSFAIPIPIPGRRSSGSLSPMVNLSSSTVSRTTSPRGTNPSSKSGSQAVSPSEVNSSTSKNISTHSLIVRDSEAVYDNTPNMYMVMGRLVGGFTPNQYDCSGR